jgi:hypothetical protein
LLPLNIMPKHEGQATVASRDSQKTQIEASEELAAPQFGQLSVLASMILNPGRRCGPHKWIVDVRRLSCVILTNQNRRTRIESVTQTVSLRPV